MRGLVVLQDAGPCLNLVPEVLVGVKLMHINIQILHYKYIFKVSVYSWKKKNFAVRIVMKAAIESLHFLWGSSELGFFLTLQTLFP